MRGRHETGEQGWPFRGGAPGEGAVMRARIEAASPRCLAVVGPFPPPLHGAAQITASFAEALERRMRVRRLNIAPDGLRRGLVYHAQRLGRVAAALCRLAGGKGRDETVYLSAAGGLGLVYTLALAAFARCLGRSLIVHHHSFAYLNRPSRIMALLVRCAGPLARHLVLCPAMKERLVERYPALGPVIVLSNAAFLPPVPSALRDAPSAASPPGASLCLGHLSNLGRDKGLDLVLGTARALGERLDRLILAGPPSDDEAARLIAEARRVLGDRLEVRGPVSGAEKAAFFASIDLFLFPTRYVNEAEPLVLLESLSAGVPVIAHGRGCIAGMVPPACGLVVPPEDSFVPAATAFLTARMADPGERARMAAACFRHAAETRLAARADLEALAASLAGPVVPAAPAAPAAREAPDA